MAKARALDKRRKSIRNIRKITRTMELIATARFKKAMDRATAATAYTDQITKLVGDLASAGLEVTHPLLEPRTETKSVTLLVLTANRGLCGGYNGNVQRMAMSRWAELQAEVPQTELIISGKRGIGGFRYRGIKPDKAYTNFEDKTSFEEVEVLANQFLNQYITGSLDRLEVVYTKFETISRQHPVVETLLPLGQLEGAGSTDGKSGGDSMYDFLPSAGSILEEIVPTSFKIKLFKCFLDAAVSEQIARMVAMKGATENAGELIKQLSMTYNRARQSQITGEIMEIIGGVEALNK
ncbi:MAG: ATP synthase F1 subunit gamma [Planctomycetales bacterium]|nr:ATP synthase F1 subunit gamma [Planctomycetales bacterium]